MLEIFKLLIGIAVLVLGIPIGDFLAKETKEELDLGKKYFIILVCIGLIGRVLGLILRDDVLLFTMFFIAIVTSRSIKKHKKKKNDL